MALRRAGRAGRLPCLDEAEKPVLVELLHQGPERLGYETPLWNCQRVADLIERTSKSVIIPDTSGASCGS